MSTTTPTVAVTPPAPQQFSPSHAKSVACNIQAARAILRTVVLALEAQEDGSISFEESETSRWNAALEVACLKLKAAKDESIETVGAPTVDLFTPLTLVEALDASLWFGYSCEDHDRLTSSEVITASKVVIESLNELLQQFDAAGIVEKVH